MADTASLLQDELLDAVREDERPEIIEALRARSLTDDAPEWLSIA
jgi:hypothetical protein